MSFQCPNKYPDCCKSDRTTSYRSSIFIILTDQWTSYANCMFASELCIPFKQIDMNEVGECPKLKSLHLNKKLSAIC
jgi:hypothetical protein